MLKRLIQWLVKSIKRGVSGKSKRPLIVPRGDHAISRKKISNLALKVLYRLSDAGFEAYLVGGGVRDVLLDRSPKDFDVATNARPEEIRQLFRHCRLIGRRFRLAHVYFGNQVIEVATFRGGNIAQEGETTHLMHSEAGMILRDNVYGTLAEDAIRRDFTVNALYYNIRDFSIVDYVGGMQDLNARCLKIIGDPYQRYQEDPVRMLRVVRFAAKLDFTIDPKTAEPLFKLGTLLKQVPNARLLDEYGKLFLSGHAMQSVALLRKYGFFAILFPAVDACLQQTKDEKFRYFLESALSDTDKRVLENKPVTLVFLFAAFFYGPIEHYVREQIAMQQNEILAFYEACDVVLSKQKISAILSKRVVQGMKEIWLLQVRMAKQMRKKAKQVYLHPTFRAAYDFLLLRAQHGDKSIKALAQWWTEYVTGDEEKRSQLCKGHQKKKTRFKKG